MINDSMNQCTFCSVPVDAGVAALVAERQEKANQAYSDASFLRTAAVAMLVFLGLSLIPLIPLVYLGFLVTFFVSIFLLIRWQVKFGSLLTADADYQKAKRSRNIAMVLVIIAIPLGFIVRPLLDVILSKLF
jgi:Ca2+/Na+ antiporter